MTNGIAARGEDKWLIWSNMLLKIQIKNLYSFLLPKAEMAIKLPGYVPTIKCFVGCHNVILIIYLVIFLFILLC